MCNFLCWKKKKRKADEELLLVALCFKCAHVVTYTIRRVHSRGLNLYLQKGFLSEMIMRTKTKYWSSRLDFDESKGRFKEGACFRFHVPALCVVPQTRLWPLPLIVLLLPLSSSQVNTARLRLTNAVPSPVSITEHVLTYWGTTPAAVLQVRGRITCDTWLLYPWWDRASARPSNSSVANVAWSAWPGALR